MFTAKIKWCMASHFIFSQEVTACRHKIQYFQPELLATYLSIKHFRHCLEGMELQNLNNRKPFTHALSSPPDRYSPREIRHLGFIFQFTSDILIFLVINCVVLYPSKSFLFHLHLAHCCVTSPLGIPAYMFLLTTGALFLTCCIRWHSQALEQPNTFTTMFDQVSKRIFTNGLVLAMTINKQKSTDALKPCLHYKQVTHFEPGFNLGRVNPHRTL